MPKSYKNTFSQLIIARFGCLECMESATVAIWSESFFNQMVACSSEPVGDTFLWLTTSSGFLSIKLLTIENAF